MANAVGVDYLPAAGLHVVQGELSILLNSMRRTFKWSSQLYQVSCFKVALFFLHKYLYLLLNVTELQEEEQDVLVKNLNQLREQLNQISSLSQINLMTVLGAFLEVVRSEDTTGPVTELALSSIFKFLCYGLIGN